MPKSNIKYELILLFEWFKKPTVIELHKKLPKGYCTLKTVYNYHARYNKAVKKAREITKGF